MQFNFYQAVWKFADQLFPPICAGCQKLGTRWCQECHEKINLVTQGGCEICGSLFTHDKYCTYCIADRPAYHLSRAYGVYAGNFRDALRSLKYKRNIGLGEIFSKYLQEIVLHQNRPIDFIVPIPLSQKRLKDRGYNQVAIISKPLAWRLNLPHHPKALKRVRDTISQINLDRAARAKNVKDAFRADEDIVSKKNILLVDDIMTTGATLNAGAQALIEAGAAQVFAIIVARAP
ncbi:MAG: ComF family protein [Chloroflexota bacterium]